MLRKRCLFCRHWFEPYAPMAKRQHSCDRVACRRKLKRTVDRAWRKRRSAAWRKELNRKLRAWAKAYPNYWSFNRERDPSYVARDNKRRTRALRRQRWACSAKQAL